MSGDKATVDWVRANVADAELRSFFVATLSARVVRE